MNPYQVFRISVIFGMAGMLVGGYFVDQAAGSILIERYVGVVVGLVIWGAAHFSKLMQRNIDWVGLVVLWLGCLVFAADVYRSNLDLTSGITTYAFCLCGCLLLRSIVPVILWCTTSTAVFYLTAAQLEQPGIVPVPFAACILLITIISSSFIISLTRTWRQRDENLALSDAVLANASDAIFYGDISKGDILRANAAAERLFATDNWSDILTSISDSLGIRIPEDLPEDLNDWVGELELRRLDGESFWANITMYRLPGYPDLMVVRVTDMSWIKRRESMLRKATTAAEEAMETRTRFLANMSHEIRTPMNGVIGMTSLLQNTNMNKEQSSYVDTIRSSGESLLVIINEILDFAKMEADEIELETFPFDLETCISDVVDMVASLAANKHLEMVLDIAPEALGQISSDSTRLRQILANLLGNAIKFTDTGQIVLEVRIDDPPDSSEADNALSSMRFTVRDTGIGISEKNLATLFDPFVQADASTTRNYGGTGLGLTICRTLVEKMGGTIEVKSAPGEGTEFTFNILAHWEPLAQWKLEHVRGKHALVVDDNPTNLIILQKYLGLFEMTCDVFSTPQQLLSSYQPGGCDVVITDMSMPGMDGGELPAALEKLGADNCPVVLLTSLDRCDVDWSQFAQVVRKPIRLTDFLQVMEQTFNPKVVEIVPRDSVSTIAALEGQSILVAEDNVVNQKVARQMLKKLGLMADIASNGEEALNMLDQHPYQILFMDMQMPIMDGVTATREIRKVHGDGPYIIAMTANARADDQQACMDAGMNDYVPKPVTLEDIRQALVRALLHRDNLKDMSATHGAISSASSSSVIHASHGLFSRE